MTQLFIYQEQEPPRFNSHIMKAFLISILSFLILLSGTWMHAILQTDRQTTEAAFSGGVVQASFTSISSLPATSQKLTASKHENKEVGLPASAYFEACLDRAGNLMHQIFW